MKTSRSRRLFRALSTGASPLLLAVALSAQPSSQAQPGQGGGAATSEDSLSHADRRFLTKVNEAGHKEMQFSQLADAQAANADVRTFAARMLADHQQMGGELQALAGQKGVELKAVDVTDDHGYKRLAGKSGTDFDKDYIGVMTDDHEDAAKLFQKEATDGKDADVKAFAEKYLPTIQQHLDRAQALKGTLGG